MLNKLIATAIVAVVFILGTGDSLGDEQKEPPSTNIQTIEYGVDALWALSGSIQPKVEVVPTLEAYAASAPPQAPSYVFSGEVEQWRGLVSQYTDWDVDIMMLIIRRESSGDPTIVSRTNDWGLCQINWTSHYDKVESRFGVADPNLLLIPENNIAICHDIFISYGSTYGAWRWL